MNSNLQFCSTDNNNNNYCKQRAMIYVLKYLSIFVFEFLFTYTTLSFLRGYSIKCMQFKTL